MDINILLKEIYLINKQVGYYVEHLIIQNKYKLLKKEKLVAAFDFDNTLINGDIEEAFFAMMINKGFKTELKWEKYLEYSKNGQEHQAYTEIKKDLIKLNDVDIETIFSEIYKNLNKFIEFKDNNKIYQIINPKPNLLMKILIEILKQLEFKIYVVSASLKSLILNANKQWFNLDEDKILASEFYSNDFKIIYGSEKEAILKENGVENLLISGGDNIGDIHFLNLTISNGLCLIRNTSNANEIIPKLNKDKNIILF